MGRNVRLEADVRATGARLTDPADADAATLLATVKRASFGDRDLATLAGVSERDVRAAREALGLRPGYAMVDTCAAEFAAETPYFYATYASAGSPPEVAPVPRPAALVIGSGPVRIGQGIEFDYCAVHAADVLRRAGWSAVMVNSNPETVSTDFDASTRLYFEPLDAESVRSVINAESDGPDGPLAPIPAVVAFGGQTPLNLAAALAATGVPLLGSDLEAIDQAEERTRFAALLDRLGIPQPEGGMAHSVEEALRTRGAHRLPGHRAALVRHRRARHRLRVLARGSRPSPRRRGGRRSRPAGAHRPVPRGHRGRRRRHLRRRRRAHPGPPRARRAGGRPLGRLGRRCSRHSASRAGTWT